MDIGLAGPSNRDDEIVAGPSSANGMQMQEGISFSQGVSGPGPTTALLGGGTQQYQRRNTTQKDYIIGESPSCGRGKSDSQPPPPCCIDGDSGVYPDLCAAPVEDVDVLNLKESSGKRTSKCLKVLPSEVVESFPQRAKAFFSELYNLSGANEGPGVCAYILTTISVLLIVVTAPVSLFFCIKVVQEYERAVIFRLGRLLRGGAKGPGIFFIIPCIDTYCKVDLRTVSFDVPPQEILSRDSVTVAVDAVVYYRISNATIAVSNVEDYGHSTRLLAATTLRNVLGTKNLSEILSEREIISHIMQSSLDEATDPWGVKVERVEIKDVRLPVQLQRAMAAEAEATREARAKVIAAEGEQRASRALKEAADVMVDTPAALQLRYLQTLNSIAAEKNSTIVFPIPMELFNGFIKK